MSDESQIFELSAKDWQVAECPGCGNPMRIHPADVGNQLTCPVCGNQCLVEDYHLPEVSPPEEPTSASALMETTRPKEDEAAQARSRRRNVGARRHAHRHGHEEAESTTPEREEIVEEAKPVERYEHLKSFQPLQPLEEGGEAPAPALDPGDAQPGAMPERFEPAAWEKPAPEPWKNPEHSTPYEPPDREVLEEEMQERQERIEEWDKEVKRSGRGHRLKKLRFGPNKKLVVWDEEEGKEEKEKRVVKKAGKRFLIASLGLLFVAAVTLIVIVVTSDSRTGKETAEEAAKRRKEASAALRDEVMKNPIRVLQRIRPLAHDFLAARNVNERLKYVRHPERVGPLMETYYEDHPDVAFSVRGVAPDSGIAYRNDFVVVRVEMEDYSYKQLAIDFQGERPLVDWESFVGFCEMEPALFREKLPTEPTVMRGSVKLAKSPYFNYLFTDEQLLDCFTIRFPDQSSIYGYALRFSSEAETLREWLADDGSTLATLKLKFPENTPTSNQVWITEVMEEGWVIGLGRKDKVE